MNERGAKAFRATLTAAAWVALAALFLFPFYWMVNSSLKGPEAVAEYPPRFLPMEQLTAPLPERDLPVVDFKQDGLVVRGALLGEGRGRAFVLMLRGDELTQDLREVPREAPRPTGRSVPLKGRKGYLARTPGGSVAVVLAARETPWGRVFYWIPRDSLAKPWRLRVSGEGGLTPMDRLRPRWRNYVEALTRYPFGVYFRNTLFLCVMVTIGQLLSSSLAAYAFARLRFPGRDFWFMTLLATMMIPASVTLIPMFIGYKTIGWVDSFLPLIVPQFCAGAFNVFLLRQFFLTLPRELDEAARVDGASHFAIYWRIVLPLSKPALIVVGVFTFVWCWKDLMGPLIYLDSADKRTIALGLEYLRNPHRNNAHLIMAAATVALLPLALIFILAQKYILKGIALTGLKR